MEKMETSFNCYVLSNETDIVLINIHNENNERHTTLNNKKYYFNIIPKTDILLDVSNFEIVYVSVMRELKLWKVNVKNGEIKDQNISTREDIVQKLRGVEMESQELFEKYFRDELDELNNPKFVVSNIT